MAQSLKQQEEAAEDNLNRIKAKRIALENGQKIILGSMLITAARTDARIREWLINKSNEKVTREADKKRIKPLIEELAKIQKPEANNEPKNQNEDKK